MAIMDHNVDGTSSFDDAPFLLSHEHDFLRHTATPFTQPNFVSAKGDQDHLSRKHGHASASHSPAGDLTLTQLQGLPQYTGDDHGHKTDSQLMEAWHAQHDFNSQQTSINHGQHSADLSTSAQNSLGLLGSDFTQSNASSTPPPLQQRIEQQQQQQQPFANQHQQMHVDASGLHNAMPDAGPTAFTSHAPWLRGANVHQTMNEHPLGATLHRQQSISSLSDASSHNDEASAGSQSQFDPTSPIRTAFTPLQSPMGMSHSISSLAGLAIGTPQQHIMNPHALEEYVASHGQTFTGDNHEQLLSLSGMHSQPHSFNSTPASVAMQPASLMMAPPAASNAASNSNRRRHTGVAHTLYTGQVRQLRQDMEGMDDVTPMPPSQQTFAGHPSSSDVSSMAASSRDGNGSVDGSSQQRHSGQFQQQGIAERLPSTPRSARQSMHQVTTQYPPAVAGNAAPFYTPQSQNAGSTSSPTDDSSALGSSVHGSAFSAPRLNRMDSFDSFTTGSAISTPSSEEAGSRSFSGSAATGQSLEAAFAEHEAKLAASHGASQQVSTSDSSFGDRTISPTSPHNGGMMMTGTPSSSSAMSRVFSAPAHHHDVQNSHANGGVPTTPVRTSSSMDMSQGMFHGGQPFTPHHQTAAASIFHATGMPGFQTPQMHEHHQAQRLRDLTMSAPHMAPSRSMSSLPSPGLLTSPMSPMDMQQHQYAAAAAAAAAAAGNNPFGSPTSPGDDGMIRSPSNGVSRAATPRSRGRNAALPPLIVSSADKMHVCFCGKRFKRLEHLKRHNRVHTQERPHPCPAPGCNKWFGRTDNLTQHLKTHYRTLGRTSESLLQITQAAAAAKANGPEARGLVGGSGAENKNAATYGSGDMHDAQHHEARHDPHAAAAAAAAQAVSKTNMKRRITLSNDMLGGPISLNSPSARPASDVAHPTQRNSSSSPQPALSFSGHSS